MSKVVVGMGYLEDGWKSSKIHAQELFANLKGLERTYDIDLYAPQLGHAAKLLDRRWRFGRDIPQCDIFHLVDPAYADVLLRLPKEVIKIVTVTDAAFWVHRNWLNTPIRKLIVEGLRRADFVIAISGKSKLELMQELGIATDKVNYLGVDPHAFAVSDVQRKKNQLLHIGSNQFRKGIDRIIRLMHFLPNHFQFLQIGAQFNPMQLDLIRDYGLEQRVMQVHHGSFSEIVKAYQSSGLFLFPSRYEGFGMPCVEARLTGIPILVSQGMPALEVLKNDTGSHCVNFDEFDNAEPSSGKSEVVNWIEENSGRQIAIANRQLFSWLETAKNCHSIYEKLLNREVK